MKVLNYIAKYTGYIIALGVLLIVGMFVGIYFVSTDSQPQDAAILTPMVMTPAAFITGVLLHKLFNRKRKNKERV